MSFYDNYVAYCNIVGKSPSAVALEIGLTKPTVNRWKNGSQPTDATVRRVADYFGVEVDNLLGNIGLSAFSVKQQKKPADPKISGLHSTGYDELTPENREVIDSLIEKLLKSQSDD